ncbi:MAG: transketolase [Pseudomonadota bacterium]|nr:transketolase [Pseudomonadota bacterium]
MSDNPKIRHNMMANAIRVLSMDAVQAANSGHPGLPMGAADIATVLFTKFLKIDPRQPNWPDRDRFVLSAGHGSMLLYALHYLMGFEDMTLDEIKNFRQLGSRTAGHPEYGHAAGIETTTGPLGQGLATSVGMALAERMLNSRFGDDLVNHFTYVLASDGDLMEGISHEAISLAGHLKLSKLIVLYDDNDISIDGPLNLAESGDALGRFEAAGWFAERIDGHDPDAIEASISAAQTHNKPTLIACKTTIGYGAPNKQGTSGVHGAPLGDEEISLTREALGWTSEPFDIPSDILDSWRMAGLKHVSERKGWQERLDAQDSEVSNRFTRVVSGDLPTRLEKAVQEYKQSLAENPSKHATRKSSEDALKAIVPTVPEMIGGSADLTGSNNTRTPEQEAVSADNYGGSFIHYGIREFGMAAVMNGMALHGGFIPYSGTFLVFSDYSRPALRLAALMEQRVIHVLTHDSIGLGEDGPTHQPVEHLAALRAIPNLLTLRPADSTETLECWQIALEQSRTPSAMALTRQGLPAVRLEYSEKNLSAKGAYELASADGDALVTLLATGSEVHLAIEAKQQLEAENIGTRVISMPCFELFDKQKSSYRDDVLGNTTVRIAIEAAIRQGWDAYLRPGDGFIGMESFGASAPADRLFEHFGITVDTIVKNVKDRLDT